MQTDFEIIAKFLARSGTEVEGRGMDVPDAAILELFQKFASGNATAEERAELVRLVNSHPNWIAALAEEIKHRRQKTRPKEKP
jgi:hypothetical protein